MFCENKWPKALKVITEQRLQMKRGGYTTSPPSSRCKTCRLPVMSSSSYGWSPTRSASSGHCHWVIVWSCISHITSVELLVWEDTENKVSLSRKHCILRKTRSEWLNPQLHVTLISNIKSNFISLGIVLAVDLQGLSSPEILKLLNIRMTMLLFKNATS